MGAARSKPVLPRLRRDELHCVFAFLEWPELFRCLLVCRDWCADAASLRKSCAAAATVRSHAQAELLLRSPLCAHVAILREVTLTEWLTVRNGSLWSRLPAIAEQLPHLQRLELQLPVRQLLRLRLGFPARLQVLQLIIRADGGGTRAEVAAALVSFAERLAGVVPPTLRSLSVFSKRNDGSVPSPPAALNALAQIDSLTALHVAVDWDDPAVRAFCRGLPQLRSLRCTHGCWTAASLAQLTQGQLGVDYPPLESLDHVDSVDSVTLPLLLRLPTLTELQPCEIELRDMWPLLSGLPLLTSLRVQYITSSDGLWWRVFVEALALCPQLTDLALGGTWNSSEVRDEYLAAIVRAVPRLQSLGVRMERLTTLRCLSETPHLAHTLQRLSLWGRGHFSVSELNHLRPLRELRELRVAPLSGWSLSTIRARLTPGHAQFDRDCWPHLRSVKLGIV